MTIMLSSTTVVCATFSVVGAAVLPSRFHRADPARHSPYGSTPEPPRCESGVLSMLRVLVGVK